MPLQAKNDMKWAILLPVFIFFADTMCVWPGPRFLGHVAFTLGQFSLLTALAFLIAVPVSIHYALKRQKPEFLACLCFIALWIMAVWSASLVRHRAIVRASRVGDQIVQALARYRDDNGDYPATLEKLCPDYLEQIPFTGLIGYPDFSYSSVLPGNYELRIDCPNWAFNFDSFIYWPSEKYPDHYGGRVERIGRWAYLHD